MYKTYLRMNQFPFTNWAQTDCVNYKYEWETYTLTCEEGKSQIAEFGKSQIALGEAYRKLSSESASDADIYSVITLIDRVNKNYQLEIITILLDRSDIDEAIKTNLYNKALLRAALESKQFLLSIKLWHQY